MITRRDFLRTTSGAAAIGVVGLAAARVDAEPPPEVTTLRIGTAASVCLAPQYVAEMATSAFHRTRRSCVTRRSATWC